MTTRIAFDFDTLTPAVADKVASALTTYIEIGMPLVSTMMHGSVVTYDDPKPPVQPVQECTGDCPLDSPLMFHDQACPVWQKRRGGK
jgi:hypothetical protein